MNKSNILKGILVLALLIPGLMFAQNGKVRGIVTDAQTGDPLPATNVVIEGTTLGASSDLNGAYVVLGVPPGLYTVRADFIGYQAVTISNIRVSADLTTTQDFQLTPSPIEVGALEIVAERPLVQRNTTNTVRMTKQHDSEYLQFRGLQNILALNAGTVQQNGALHIRGGRFNEVAYFVDGAQATNPQYNSENISVIQEAVEEIQMQAGGFTAEFGGANSGVVKTTIRSGGPGLSATIDYRTDDFAGDGGEFLGTTSRGYHNLVMTVGGPLTSKLRYFVAGQYNYTGNRSALFIEPFKFSQETNPEWFFDDGLEGRDAGTPLPGPVEFKKNFLPNHDRRDVDINGTLVYNLSTAFKLRLSGSYAYDRMPGYLGLAGQSVLQATGVAFVDALQSTFWDRENRRTTKTGLVSLRATHLINSNTFYDLSVNWSSRSRKTFDPEFGDDWMKYSDRREFDAHGYDTSEWQSIFRGPRLYSTIFNFRFTPPGAPVNNYNKNSQSSLGVNFDLTTQLNKNIELKVGGNFDRWTMRYYNVGNISQALAYLFGSDGQTPRTFESDYIRRVELSKGRQGAISFYGWDVDGKNKINSGPLGPRHPVFASAYAQTKWEYRDLIVNFGLRYERFDPKILMPKNVEEPAFDKTNDWINEDELIESDAFDFLLPRVNFAFPVTDRTVFYAQFGKYAQMPRLTDLYRGGVRTLSRDVSEESRSLYGYFGQYVGFTAKPERTTQYELGIRQSITDDFALTLTAFYKNLEDQLRRDRVLADGTGELAAGTPILVGWINNDIGTTKGLEMTLELRRTKRLAAKVQYTLSNTRGTGSDSRSTRVAVSDATISDYPKLIYNLDYNQTHRGTVMLDYRFAKGEGGSILQGLGINTILYFNSGHNYTQLSEPHNLGQATPWNVGVRATLDRRGANPVEPLNTSTTPWNFNVDMTLNKMLYFRNFNIRLYTTVLNVFNTRNVINVYETTGTDDDDGWLKSPLAAQYIIIPGYLPFYRAINLDNRYGYELASGNDLWGPPREIRFGLMLEFNK
ncbi:MAG: TonB-dependent receptor domain-containing protein [bacterium]